MVIGALEMSAKIRNITCWQHSKDFFLSLDDWTNMYIKKWKIDNWFIYILIGSVYLSTVGEGKLNIYCASLFPWVRDLFPAWVIQCNEPPVHIHPLSCAITSWGLSEWSIKHSHVVSLLNAQRSRPWESFSVFACLTPSIRRAAVMDAFI